MVRFTVDNRNRLIFYGNPVGYVKADTGDNAAHQQLCDRLACGDAVEDHHQAGRDHGSQRTADGLYRSGEILGIAAALHLRIHQAADSRRCSGSGAGKGGKDGGRHDGDNAQTAADTPQQHRGHIHKTLGDAALAHHLTGDDKGGDCQKTEVVGAGKNALCQQHQRHSVHRQQSGNAGQRQRPRHRNADDHEQQQADKQYDRRTHAFSSFRFVQNSLIARTSCRIVSISARKYPKGSSA